MSGLASGTRIGPYEIVGPLGSGGMGEVFRARDARLGRDVALKMLPEALRRDGDRLMRLRREARILASFSHPHIAVIHGLEETDAGLVLVLELVPGETLADRLGRGPIPLDETLAIARQLADGLEAAHERGVIHRDLKPANVKIAADGTVKLLDFGLAKAALATQDPDLSQASTLSRNPTDEGLILGTAAYMSPEQARGKPVDKRTDIWSFGVVLYEMLSGQRLFAGETVSDVLASVLTRHIEWKALPEHTPPLVTDLLQRCLERDPRMRLRDIGEARIALSRPVTRPDGTPAKDRLRVRERVAWMLAAGLAVAAVGLSMGRRPRPRQAFAVNTIVPLPDGVRVELNGNLAGTVVVSPDGRRLVFGARRGMGRTQLWVRELASDAARPLEGTQGAARPFWSPDGRNIGFFGDGQLRRISAEGGPVSALTRVNTVDARGGSWSAGTILFSPHYLGPLHRISERGGEAGPATVLEKAGGDSSHRYPSFLPDGRHFLFLRRFSGTGAGGEAGIHVAGGELSGSRLLVPAASNAVFAAGHLLFVLEGALMAQAFDPQRLTLQGEPRMLVSDLLVNRRYSFGAFSASDDVLVFQTGRQHDLSQLTWLDRTGQRLSVLGDPGIHYGAGGLALSPDGRRCVVARVEAQTGEADLWLYDLVRGTSTRLPMAGTDESEAIFTPDGASLVFTSFGAEGTRVLRTPIEGGLAARPVLPISQGGDGVPQAVSGDGRMLVVERRDATGQTDLILASLEGNGSARALVGTSSMERMAQISPDGRYMAYVSDESGRPEVYVTGFPAASGRLQVSREGGAEPRWRADGKELFYFAADNTLTATEVVWEGASLSFGRAEELFQVPDHGNWRYLAAGDGKRFLVSLPVEENQASPIRLITNWAALLR